MVYKVKWLDHVIWLCWKTLDFSCAVYCFRQSYTSYPYLFLFSSIFLFLSHVTVCSFIRYIWCTLELNTETLQQKILLEQTRREKKVRLKASSGFISFPHCPFCVVVPASSACPPLPPSLFSSLALAVPSRPSSDEEELLPDFIMVTQWTAVCGTVTRLIVLLSCCLKACQDQPLVLLTLPQRGRPEQKQKTGRPPARCHLQNSSSVRTAGLFTPGKPIIPKESYLLAFTFISLTVAQLNDYFSIFLVD